MTNAQRMRNDMATDKRRESADKTMSKSRDKNDALTQERRFEADRTMDKNRIRNDEITSDRRDSKDANSPRRWALAIFLWVLIIFLIGLTIGTLLT